MTTSGERPGTTVEQEFIAAAQVLEDPELPVCLVGRALQLEEDLDAGDYDARAGADNEVGGSDFVASYPDLILNATVDDSSVSAKFQNTNGTFDVAASDLTPNSPTAGELTIAKDAEITRAIIAAAGAGAITQASNVLADTGQKFISSQVQAGDVVTFLSGSLSGSTRNVASVTSQTAIVLDGAVFTVDESNISYKIERTEKAWGTVLVTYEAVRSDLNDVLTTITDDDSIEDAVGPIDPRNPAGFAVSKARLNANDAKIFFTGVDADTVEEFTRAYEFLESKEVYNIVPLTQDVAILALAPPHVNSTSEPENKHERVAWLNRALVTRETKISSSQSRTGSYNVSTKVFTDDAGGVFKFSDYVSPGDFIIYDDSGTIRELLVQQVGPSSSPALTEDEVLINEPGSVNYPLANLASDPYTALSDEKSKTEQAQYLASYANAFSNRRIIVTWPDVVEVSFGGLLQQVPGYFLSAATAGLKSGQRPQQPLTNLAVAGFTRLFNSNTYFNEEQLKILDAGGIMVHEQLVTDGPITVRRQRTTNTTELKKTELSIVNIADFVSKFLRQELDPYTGKYNITPQYLEMLKVVINGLTARLKETTTVGPVILEGTLISIEQNAVELDTVDIEYQIEAPVPGNFIRVKLQI